MTKLQDAPVRSKVPTGGYVLISEPSATGSALSTFAKVPASSLGSGSSGSSDLSNALLNDRAPDGSGGSGGGIGEAPNDAFSYGRHAAAWTQVLPLAGGKMTGKLNVGATGWLEAVIPATEVFSDFVSLSRIAGPGGVFGTRTSDGGATGGMGAWALGSFVLNDNTSAVQTGYGGYFETRRSPGAGTVEGLELAVVNSGNTVANQPYYLGASGSTIGLLVGAGRDDVTPNNDVSLAVAINGGNALFQRGIMFGWNSVRPAAGIGAVAMALPPLYSLVWYIDDGGASHGTGVPGALIRSDMTTLGSRTEPASLIFANNGLNIDPGNNSTAAQFGIGLNTFQSTQINGLLSIQNGGTEVLHVSSAGDLSVGGTLTVSGVTGAQALGLAKGLGVFGTAPLGAKPTVTGSRGGNAAVQSLLTALAAYGLIVDGSSA